MNQLSSGSKDYDWLKEAIWRNAEVSPVMISTGRDRLQDRLLSGFNVVTLEVGSRLSRSTKKGQISDRMPSMAVCERDDALSESSEFFRCLSSSQVCRAFEFRNISLPSKTDLNLDLLNHR